MEDLRGQRLRQESSSIAAHDRSLLLAPSCVPACGGRSVGAGLSATFNAFLKVREVSEA